MRASGWHSRGIDQENFVVETGWEQGPQEGGLLSNQRVSDEVAPKEGSKLNKGGLNEVRPAAQVLGEQDVCQEADPNARPFGRF